ncbi:MAG: carboxypeptidase M32, partial [Myxococcota bacterium]
IETQVCRGRSFLEFAAPIIREELGIEADDRAFSVDNLVRRSHRVARGHIRVDADEVTYATHVLVRYELEKALVSGALAVEDLPDAWGDTAARLVGLRPPDDRLGCLQDIHWYDGAFGYFPSYTLGAMLAAQLYRAATEAIGALDEQIRSGDFGPLVSWLRTNVHVHGAAFGLDTLAERATGAVLGPDAFLGHLEARYLA